MIRRYLLFLFKQFRSWPQQNYYLFFFSLGCQLMLWVTRPFTVTSTIVFIGTVIGVAGICAINAARSVSGWLGLIACLCTIYIDYVNFNYLNGIVHVIYIFIIYGPIIFSKYWNNNMETKIRKFSSRQWIISLILTFIVYIVAGFVVDKFTNDPRPWVDSITLAIGLTGAVICALRYSNQYFWWIASDIVTIILWYVSFREGGHATLAMFVNSMVYFVNDVLGFTVSPWFNNVAREKLGKLNIHIKKDN